MKRIKHGALPVVSTPYRIVGRLREASRQNPPPGPKLVLCVSKADCLTAIFGLGPTNSRRVHCMHHF
nr:hypothetical protein [Methylomarinum sp. Ch1-1]MDP4521285.1 hypothetical protein [Methylomarinum sp. Ch1-1]